MASTILQTISLAYLFVILTCTASLLSHDEECLCLFEFKQTVFHENYAPDGFQKLDTWRKINDTNNSSDSDCCLWGGVVCSNKGHVIGLDLSQSSLNGVINSSSTLFKLVHLQVLNLSMNNFVESQIPSEIARLNQLRSLDLSNAGFTGQIPNEISHLKQLTWIDLSWNPLKLLQNSHGGIDNLLQNMTRLEVLHLSGVDLSSSVPHFLANFSSLSSIKLSGCQLQDEFPSEIFHLPKLKHLIIGDNSDLMGSFPEFYNNTLLERLGLAFTGFAGILPESIGNLTHLNALDLQGCYFSGGIPGSLQNLTQLTYLSLYNNKFTGPVPSLESLSKLTILGLGFNRFDLGYAYDWISKLTLLNELFLEHMNIHGEILPYLANLTKLSFISMEGNSISGRIPSSFKNLTQLTTLNLQVNQFQGQVSSSFLNFQSLEYLALSDNNFSGTVSLDSFLGLNKLKVLDLSSNRLSFVSTKNYTNGTLPELKILDLSDCNLKEFPAFLRFQTKMTSLIFINNEIEGLIPNWIWNNSHETLQEFVVKNNFITGFHQHPRFIPSIRLEVFVVSYNQLQGLLPVPPETIVIYDVSNNNLTGNIPQLICEVSNNSLSALDMKENYSHGKSMVNTCTHGRLLKHINLSKNRFTGQVPKSLARCRNLEFLSLADNSFEDVFPHWLGTLPNLQVLILSSNKFYGSIQGLSTISSPFVKLRIFDISNNNFGGRLPMKSFQTWNAMKSVYVVNMSSMMSFDDNLFLQYSYFITLTSKGVKRDYTKTLTIFTFIDLSCNNFEGEIPQSIQDLHGLQSLNLSNNHFTGRILPALGNLKNLESLDLSQNELSGQIPQQLLQLGFLAIWNVSFNHLDGHIPQGKQFNTFENNSYLGNPRLCGKPLSNNCEKSIESTVHPPSINEYESLMSSDIIDWMVILLGVGSGLIMGLVIGCFLNARYGDWLLERLGMKQDRWVRPLRNTRRR